MKRNNCQEDNVVLSADAEPENISINFEDVVVDADAPAFKRIRFNFNESLERLLSYVQDKSYSKMALEDYIAEGGSCLSLLQTLEQDEPNSPPSVVFELAAELIKYVKYYNSQMHYTTLEACRYILNTHLPLVNKMMQISSTSNDKIAALKLLSAMVIFSPSLVKDILQNVKFHLRFLTKHEYVPETSIRLAFIDFICAIFNEGHYPSILQLINQKYLFVSIMPGLQYDPMKTVQKVLKCLKVNLIDNEFVPKPIRLKVFDHVVLKSLVNLYEWKGQSGINVRRQVPVTEIYVDAQKSKSIAKAVHKCLLVLCTSIKRGLVFRDDSLGFSKQHRNPLMFSIIESLNDDFGVPLREELIVKMAVEFPELTRAVWNKLLPILKPRNSPKWFKAIEFMRLLLDSFQPTIVKRYVNYLNPLQYAQAIQILAAPKLILQELCVENFIFDDDQVKLQVAMTLHSVLRSVKKFLASIKSNLTENNSKIVCKILQEHLSKSLPSSQLLTDDWTKTDNLEYKAITLKMLQLYNNLCPELVDNWKLNDSTKVQLLEMEDSKNTMLLAVFKITLIEVLLELEPGSFNITNDIFTLALTALSGNMQDEELNTHAKDCLHQILISSSLFGDCDLEIQIWIESLRHKRFSKFFCQALRNLQEHAEEYAIELREFRHFEETTSKSDDLLLALCSEEDIRKQQQILPKPVSFSSVLLAALKQNPKKKIKIFLGQICLQIFHLQTDYISFQNLIKKYGSCLPESVQDYILNWHNNNDIELDVKHLPLRMILECSIAVFKIVHLTTLSDEVYDQCLQIVKNYLPNVIDFIYYNYKLYTEFKPEISMVKTPSMKFLIDITQYIQTEHKSIDLSVYLKPYQNKLTNVISKFSSLSDIEVLKTKSKYSSAEFSKIMEIFGFNHEDWQYFLNNIKFESRDLFDSDSKLNLIYSILITSLNAFNNYSETASKLLPITNIAKLLIILTELNNRKENVDSSEFAKALHKYLILYEDYIISEEIINDLFTSCILKEEYCRENALLALHIYKIAIKSKFSLILQNFTENIKSICAKKGLILPFLDIVDFNIIPAEKIYKSLTSLLERTLNKPQKAGSHFENHYMGFCKLIKMFMPLQEISPYLKKIQKFDTNEAFLISLLKVMFVKYFTETKEKDEAHACNAILTIVHFVVSIFKSSQKKTEEANEDTKNLQIAADAIIEVTECLPRSFKLTSVRKNETFNQFYILCLKHGVSSSKSFLMNVLSTLGNLIKFSDEDAGNVMDLLFGHSKFIDSALDKPSESKLAIFKFVYSLCIGQPKVMQKKQVPILLSAYSATLHPADRCILAILKLYETNAAQTNIYDFKPFLWDISAANFYSVRVSLISRFALRRAPKAGDVLDILQLSKVESTLVNFPLNTPLREKNIVCKQDPEILSEVYDLGFLLASFSQILAPENTFQTYKFTQSGALSLIVISLASANQEIRMAACHNLARFYYHLEGKSSGKDQLLWLRFIESLTKGTGKIENFKLNNFSAIFMARTALVLSNPTDSMYTPLSNFIAVKIVPVLTKIPELYTFIHSADMEYLIYRQFILQILLDGMRTLEDFTVAMKAMAFKLILELFNSSICDMDSRVMILDIIDRAVSIPQAAKELCQFHSLTMWLYNIRNIKEGQIMEKVITITNKIKSYEKFQCGAVDTVFIQEDHNVSY